MEIRRTVPAWDAVERKVRVCDILWLATLQVVVTYAAFSEDDPENVDAQTSLFVVNLPPAKEVNKSASWRDYEDPCYGKCGHPQYDHLRSRIIRSKII